MANKLFESYLYERKQFVSSNDTNLLNINKSPQKLNKC